jgi:hypothetical protein
MTPKYKVGIFAEEYKSNPENIKLRVEDFISIFKSILIGNNKEIFISCKGLLYEYQDNDLNIALYLLKYYEKNEIEKMINKKIFHNELILNTLTMQNIENCFYYHEYNAIGSSPSACKCFAEALVYALSIGIDSSILNSTILRRFFYNDDTGKSKLIRYYIEYYVEKSNNVNLKKDLMEILLERN